MDHLRVLLVPFHATSLLLVGIVLGAVHAFSTSAVCTACSAACWLQIWMFKYCYVLIEHIADGASEPPVMSTDMLSPFEIRPWVQLAIVIARRRGLQRDSAATRASRSAAVLLVLLPASIAVLGVGEPFYQAVNPLTVVSADPRARTVLPAHPGVDARLSRRPLRCSDRWACLEPRHARGRPALRDLVLQPHRRLRCTCAATSSAIEPSRSPERAAAREETERVKVRAHMLDDVFQQVRIGKHVEATRPLAQWLRDLDGEHCRARRAVHRGRAGHWLGHARGLEHHRQHADPAPAARGPPRCGAARSSSACAQRAPTLTLDSADDLRTLAEYAEGAGPRRARGLDAAGNPGLPAAQSAVTRRGDNCQGALLTGSTSSTRPPGAMIRAMGGQHVIDTRSPASMAPTNASATSPPSTAST